MNQEIFITRRQFNKLFVGIVGSLLHRSTPIAWLRALEPKPTLDPEWTNIVCLADAHHNPIDRNDGRQYNSQVLSFLHYLPYYLKGLPIDIIINLGDLITEFSGQEVKNLELFEQGIKALKTFAQPLINLLGNHDLWGARLDNLLMLYQKYDLPPTYGVIPLPERGCQIVWLDFEEGENGPILSPERLAWLKEVTAKTPSIIMTHHNLFPIDSPDNYYFGTSWASALRNGAEVWAAIKGNPIMGVISGHAHEAKTRIIDGIPFIFLPAFVENQPGITRLRQCPGILTMVSVKNHKKFKVASYLGADEIFNFPEKDHGA